MPIQPKQQPPYYEQGTKESSYIATITQTGTGNITVFKELKNTIGPITYTRNSIGTFTIGSAGLFIQDKTWIAHSEGNGYATYPISSTGINKEGYIFKILGPSQIELQFFNASYTNVDPSTLLGDGFYLNLPEIKVFNY